MAATPGALWLNEHAGGAEIVLRANSIVAALNAAMVGMGITIVPCFLADAEPMLARLTPRLLGERDVLLVVHPDMAKVARIRAVMDYLIESFASEDESERASAAHRLTPGTDP
jgi:DNA-binding transcriptional LysR family regulator